MNILQIVIKKLVLPNSPWFWLFVAVVVFFVLVATGHLFTALTILFLGILIAVGIKTLQALSDPYVSNDSKAVWVLVSVVFLVLVIGFSILTQREWRPKTTQTETTPTQIAPAIQQTLPASSNQTSSNQTPP